MKSIPNYFLLSALCVLTLLLLQLRMHITLFHRVKALVARVVQPALLLTSTSSLTFTFTFTITATTTDGTVLVMKATGGVCIDGMLNMLDALLHMVLGDTQCSVQMCSPLAASYKTRKLWHYVRKSKWIGLQCDSGNED